MRIATGMPLRLVVQHYYHLSYDVRLRQLRPVVEEPYWYSERTRSMISAARLASLDHFQGSCLRASGKVGLIAVE